MGSESCLNFGKFVVNFGDGDFGFGEEMGFVGAGDYYLESLAYFVGILEFH